MDVGTMNFLLSLIDDLKNKLIGQHIFIVYVDLYICYDLSFFVFSFAPTNTLLSKKTNALKHKTNKKFNSK